MQISDLCNKNNVQPHTTIHHDEMQQTYTNKRNKNTRDKMSPTLKHIQNIPGIEHGLDELNLSSQHLQQSHNGNESRIHFRYGFVETTNAS